MTIDHSYPYQHEWHLARPIEEFGSSVLGVDMVLSVWICPCGAIKRHVTRRPDRLLVYDPDGLQNHESEMDDIELVDDIP